MSPRLLLLIAVFIGFSFITAPSILEVGPVGIIDYQLAHWAGIQVLTDLVIMATFVMIWMVIDARKIGLNPWPFVVATMVAGSFGPLAYLIWREIKQPKAL